MQDIGKLLFSFTIHPDMEWSEFRNMGRSVRYATSKKLLLLVMAAVVVVVFLSIFVTAMLLLLLAIVAVNVLLYMEYSARDIGQKIREKTPLKYDFYEDGIIETDAKGAHTIIYIEFSYIKADSHAFVMMGKGTDVVVIPRSLVDKHAEELILKLARILARKK